MDRLVLIRVCDAEDNGVMTAVAGIQMNQSQHAVNQSTDALLTEHNTLRTTLTPIQTLSQRKHKCVSDGRCLLNRSIMGSQHLMLVHVAQHIEAHVDVMSFPLDGYTGQ